MMSTGHIDEPKPPQTYGNEYTSSRSQTPKPYPVQTNKIHVSPTTSTAVIEMEPPEYADSESKDNKYKDL